MVKGLGSACMHAGPPQAHTYGTQVRSGNRADAPGNLSRRLQIKGKHTFGYDTANSLTTTYSLNYNSVSCCKLFRAHKHHNKTSLQPQIHTENLHISPVSLRREGKHGLGKCLPGAGPGFWCRGQRLPRGCCQGFRHSRER